MTPDSPTEAAFAAEWIMSPDFSRDPQPYYRRMRDTSPVVRTEAAGGMVFIAGHEQVDTALHDTQLFSSQRSAKGRTLMIPIMVDPPEHRDWRRLLDPMFNPREMAKLEPGIRRRANELIDGFIDRGECDYVEEFAVPLPVSVFLELLGLPLDETAVYIDLKERLLRGGGGQLLGNDEVRTKASEELHVRFTDLITARRSEPRDDLLTRLINSEVAGRAITHEELIGICIMLFVAGLDTVTDSLSCFLHFLANNPEHRERILREPEVIPRASEEMLRYECPALFSAREATRDVEVSGCPVQAGDKVLILLGSANTDERAIDRPDVVDFDRESNRHFSFGGGVHRCLGSHLARLELRIALEEWHRRIPEYRIAEGADLKFATMLRQIDHLPLVFEGEPHA